MSALPSKRFRVAFSFAGEKRAFVQAVAEGLAGLFGKEAVLYYKYHEAEFAMRNLGMYLPDLYHTQSDLIVVVVCPHYDEKNWTGLEWAAIHALLGQRRDKEVMLCRFDKATVQGLYEPNAGFIELDHKTPKETIHLILERLAINEGQPRDRYTRQPAKTTAAPRTTTPNNLPRLPFFFGREEELKRIAKALEGRGWGALIDGPGGMGKTALAIRAAELVPQGRFQRIAFLTAKKNLLTPEGQRALGSFVLPGCLDMFNAIARELDRPDLTKGVEDQRASDLLHALEGTGTLLVLDNLESLSAPDRAEMFAFLDRLPQGCNAIVTSRRRADSTAVAIRLDRLEWPAAHELLEALAEQGNEKLRKAGEAAWQALHEVTGGNPLLMTWVAGQLPRGARTLAQATERLRSPEARNDPLEFVFGDLLETFTEQESKALAALVHFTLPAPVKFIAGLAELNEPAAQAALDDLAARALVVPDEEARHFLLVPLVADFLRRKRPEAVQAAATRLESQAYALAMENGYQKHDRFPVLDEHWPALAAALPLLVAGPNKRLQTVCDALRDFLNFSGRWDEWLKLLRQAEEKAVAAGNFLNAGWRAYETGWVHLLRGQAAEVLACAGRAETHWLQPAAEAGARERAVALSLHGDGHQLAQNHPVAIQALCEVVELWRTLNPESEDVTIGLNALATAEKESGDLDAAERDYREALRIARALDDQSGVALYTGNLAGLALDRQDWPAAEALAREALPLSEKLGRLELIAYDCHLLAEALARQGRPAEGLPLARRAVALYTQLRSPDLVAAEATLKRCEGGEA